MTKMIQTPSGDYIHPQDFVRRRRWVAVGPTPSRWQQGGNKTGRDNPRRTVPAESQSLFPERKSRDDPRRAETAHGCF
jgi:hypothetical protein